MARAVRQMGPARLLFAVVAWLFVISIVVQVYLVGLEVFADLGGSTHRDFAYVYGWLAPILVLLAATSRASSRARVLSIAILVLFALQTVLPGWAEEVQVVGALHTVNAVLILGLAVALARLASRPPTTPPASG